MKHMLTLAGAICALGLSAGLQAESATVTDDLLLMGNALSEDDLSVQRGEGTVEIDALTMNELDLEGTNQGNSVMNSVTGANFIGNTAFNGASGMFDTIQNSGNNVLIQNATIVNISVTE